MSTIHYLLNKKTFFFSVLLTILVMSPGKAMAQKIVSSENGTAKYQSNLGAYHWERGEFNKAIDAWSQEAQIYRLQGLNKLEIETTLKITQTYITLGQLELAVFELKKLLSLTQETSLLAEIWNQLGSAYFRDGELERAFSAYNKSLDLEPNLLILNSLVSLQKKQAQMAQLKADSAKEGEDKQSYLAEAQVYHTQAFEYAKAAFLLSKAQDTPGVITALIAWGKLSEGGLNPEQIERGRNILANLPNSRTKIYLGINWAKIDSEQADYWLDQIQQVAESTGDITAKSYVFLEKAILAEKSAKLSDALKYANFAIDLARLESVHDVIYRANSLAGRINDLNGNKKSAFNNYQDAISSLEKLNQGLKKIDIEQRLKFKIEIEPIYRKALEFLLEKTNPSESDLKESLGIFDKLRLAQLQNYFGDNCYEIDLKRQNFNTKSPNRNVFFYSIILKNQTHFVLKLPDGTLHYSRTHLSKNALTELVTNWHSSMAINSDNYLKNNYNLLFWQHSKELYDILVLPFEKQLKQINPETIIFVNDGILRNVPMAALYDGKRFLAQKWASLSSIGLNIRAANNSQQSAKVLAFGLEKSRGTWSTLSSVPKELDDVISIMGGEKILNQKFIASKFYEQINQKQYSIIHIATHGYFGGVAENSFILAHDKNITALDINNALAQSKVPIQLLVFSACETALGSDYSILGLAGVALRSGVNSVLGNYWDVQDHDQPQLIKEWYSNIYEKGLDRAKALQKIQIREIEKKSHPSKWASFNLIGSWD